MGIICSICRRRHYTIESLSGEQIDTQTEFDELGESDELLSETTDPPPTPSTKTSKKKKIKKKVVFSI
ncbi:ORF38 [Felid gammaherpesvirus 1]|uniref:Cytoplasmic envelopment protein 3 n=1 Tax=Felid gammaherpesvirus 1 TaxID=2560468 RepID=A0A0M4MDA7_9GAMA|nr:ORF38 [Felis catus gammaherpesvirus 1]ALE14750.1 ORF38 [Felis catus gammaherpesvirus 1]